MKELTNSILGVMDLNGLFVRVGIGVIGRYTKTANPLIMKAEIKLEFDSVDSPSVSILNG